MRMGGGVRQPGSLTKLFIQSRSVDFCITRRVATFNRRPITCNETGVSCRNRGSPRQYRSPAHYDAQPRGVCLPLQAEVHNLANGSGIPSVSMKMRHRAAGDLDLRARMISHMPMQHFTGRSVSPAGWPIGRAQPRFRRPKYTMLLSDVRATRVRVHRHALGQLEPRGSADLRWSLSAGMRCRWSSAIWCCRVPRLRTILPTM
jgi:hypothetical protein